MKYFAVQRTVTDYPHSGESVWGVADSLGGFVVCSSQAAAITEALLKNATV